MLPTLGHPYPHGASNPQALVPWPLNGTLVPGPSPNWAELLAPLLMAIDFHTRQVIREEITLIAQEASTLAEAAEKDDEILTVQQAATLLGVQPQTAYEWIKAGKLASFTIGNRSIRLRRGAVLAALQAQCRPDGRRKYARRVSGTAKTKLAEGRAAHC